MTPLTHDRYILVCVRAITKKGQKCQIKFTQKPNLHFFPLSRVFGNFLMFNFSECPDCILDESKM